MSIYKRAFWGNLYKCTFYGSRTANYFVGYSYDEKLILKNEIFIKSSNNKYFVELNDLITNGRKAKRYLTEPQETGDYFIKDLKPVDITSIKYDNDKNR